MIKRDPGSLQMRNHLVRNVLAFGKIPTIFLTCFTFARAASASSIKSVFVAVEIFRIGQTLIYTTLRCYASTTIRAGAHCVLKKIVCLLIVPYYRARLITSPPSRFFFVCRQPSIISTRLNVYCAKQMYRCIVNRRDFGASI